MAIKDNKIAGVLWDCIVMAFFLGFMAGKEP